MQINVLLGPSDSGKDYVASTVFSNCQVIKLNQPFKDLFEFDHNLEVGFANDKSKRDEILKFGPYVGLPIGEAMSKAYEESVKNEGYGKKFSGLTIVETLPKIQRSTTDVVITDLRKKTEARILKAFAEEIYAELKAYAVISNKARPRKSDENFAWLCGFFDAVQITNNY